MRKLSSTNLYVALVHYPVTNKNGDTIASAVTNLDLHDIARAAKTFGVQTFYIVTPIADQQKLVERIVAHWTNGAGAAYNPARKEALELISVKSSLTEVKAHVYKKQNKAAKTVVTSAKSRDGNISFGRFRDMLDRAEPYLLILGTAWGLSESVTAQADYLLEPISGRTEYNHLSVRSAAAIILDRLVGKEKISYGND
ncbi:RNA methyltransferase [Thermodesulfobacteriota bacterium]